jgi:hypothetical protein
MYGGSFKNPRKGLRGGGETSFKGSRLLGFSSDEKIISTALMARIEIRNQPEASLCLGN